MRIPRTILIITSFFLLIIIGGVYFFYRFFGSFAPPDVTITEEYISSSRGFINGVTIEKLQVDSMGSENHPVKYTVTYMTTCHIDHPAGRPPIAPKKIRFNEEGNYLWREQNSNIGFIHEGMSRHPVDSIQRMMWAMGPQEFTTCPLKFEKEQWYFFTIGDPQITGIFYFIDKSGKEHQYYIESGVSPI